MHGKSSSAYERGKRCAGEAGIDADLSESASEYLCWTRMQVEAGQALETIVARKEIERQAGEGVFFWGVGNAPSTAINALARMEIAIPLIFSVMKSKPKPADVAPSKVVAWTSFIDCYGRKQTLPEHAVVTSRGHSPSRIKTHHYALMCRSNQPLHLAQGPPFHVEAYRNASATGGKVGASQVTALLKRTSEPAQEAGYEVNLSASLTDSYWVKLVDPVEVSPGKLAMLDEADTLQPKCWRELARAIRVEGRKRMDDSLAKEQVLI